MSNSYLHVTQLEAPSQGNQEVQSYSSVEDQIFRYTQANTVLRLQLAQKQIDAISSHVSSTQLGGVQQKLCMEKLSMLEKQCQLYQLQLKTNEQNYCREQLIRTVHRLNAQKCAYYKQSSIKKRRAGLQEALTRRERARGLYEAQREAIEGILQEQKRNQRLLQRITELKKEILVQHRLVEQNEATLLEQQRHNVLLRQQLNGLRSDQICRDYGDFLDASYGGNNERAPKPQPTDCSCITPSRQARNWAQNHPLGAENGHTSAAKQPDYTSGPNKECLCPQPSNCSETHTDRPLKPANNNSDCPTPLCDDSSSYPGVHRKVGEAPDTKRPTSAVDQHPGELGQLYNSAERQMNKQRARSAKGSARTADQLTG